LLHLGDDLVGDVGHSHALSEEIQELPLRVDEIEYDGVIDEILLLHFLIFVNFREVDSVSSGSLIDLLLGAREEREGGVKV
jgi:hypothetical protein